MDLQAYYDRLSSFDWFYEWSDDHSVWRRGSSEHAKLRAAARTSPEHKALYDRWHDHVFSGDAWGTEKRPKPERPE